MPTTRTDLCRFQPLTLMIRALCLRGQSGHGGGVGKGVGKGGGGEGKSGVRKYSWAVGGISRARGRKTNDDSNPASIPAQDTRHFI